ncbi:hypothetical protein BDA99DRAFT_532564 [Phascolomyces articulosus]|uniref:Uncharacterized protein n=1 Tax=Phascolomyces articulosus TaxID=60185 RepID=A0AAD5PJ21_9FUNG|nr:hypothetical protein BDA99DRAFT_532564 [Phascolomyces articulosus]
MSYPEEHNKGKYVAIFLAPFNLGGIAGSIIIAPCSKPWESSRPGGGISTGTHMLGALLDYQVMNKATCSRMCAISNDPALFVRYAEFYKGMQSVDAAVTFGIDAADVPLRWECLICWLLVLISFPMVSSISENSNYGNM